MLHGHSIRRPMVELSLKVTVISGAAVAVTIVNPIKSHVVVLADRCTRV